MEFSIKMVDLHTQYLRLQNDIDAAIQNVIQTTSFVKGPKTKRFEEHLSTYLDVPYVIGCGNGTDALQIALMALNLQPGDEVIVPDFTFIASAEVLALLGLKPVFAEVDPDTFNIKTDVLENYISKKTKAIIPVHMFGQSVEMEAIMEFASKHKLYVIEDNAQAIGSSYTFKDGSTKKTGTMGHMGTTSFFPSKNLGCFGDGGAIFTSDSILADRIKAIANHGSEQKYYHKYVGVNSRLDAMQAAILDVKLQHLDDFNQRRLSAAKYYSELLKEIPEVVTPTLVPNATHVFHQYTLKVKDRDKLQIYLQQKGIPTMIYYPVPLHQQEVFASLNVATVNGTQDLCSQVLSLPMHTELTREEQDFILSTIKAFYGYV